LNDRGDDISLSQNESKLSGFAAARAEIPSLFPYLRKYRRGLAVGSLCVLLNAGIAMLVPLAVSETLNYITDEANTFKSRASAAVAEVYLLKSLGLEILTPILWEAQGETLDRWAMVGIREENRLGYYFSLILGFALLAGLFRFLQRRIIIGISRKIEFDLRNDLFAHLLKLSPSFYNRMTTGDIVARATNDMNQVRSMLGPGVMYPINAVLTMVFALAGMIYLSPLLATVAMFPPLLMAIGTNRFAKTLHERFTVVQEQYSTISTKVQENLTGVRVVKAYTREEAEVEAIRTMNQDYLEKNLKYFKSMGVLYPFFDFSHNLGIFVVLSVGGMMMIQPNSTFQVGDFAAFILYLNMLHFPMISIGWVLNVIQRGVASLARINEILETQPEIRDPENPLPIAGVSGHLTFKGVDFSYDPTIPVLKGIDLDIRPGTIVGIVGATGSGKSTLTHLIPRFYDPDRGEILLDGKPLAAYRVTDIRKMIGLVAQDHFMFSATVGKNIGFGLDPADYSVESIEEASRLAVLHENVVDFPRGYDTMVGERGVTLSGGQRQRAAIARALAINPRVLILDDALSAVDTHTEEQILSGLRTVMKERATLLISHRISTVREADWIVVLQKGEIVEQGTHEDLVSLSGVYATMHRHQLLEEQIEEMSA